MNPHCCNYVSAPTNFQMLLDTFTSKKKLKKRHLTRYSLYEQNTRLWYTYKEDRLSEIHVKPSTWGKNKFGI